MATATTDATLLKKELADSAAALRTERIEAASAGRTPAYCPSERTAQPTFNDIVGALDAVPIESRAKTEVKDALRAYLGKRFPCGK